MVEAGIIFALRNLLDAGSRRLIQESERGRMARRFRVGRLVKGRRGRLVLVVEAGVGGPVGSARVFGALEGRADDLAVIDLLCDTLELQYTFFLIPVL